MRSSSCNVFLTRYQVILIDKIYWFKICFQATLISPVIKPSPVTKPAQVCEAGREDQDQVEADFQSPPGQPGLYHQPQLRSRLEQIWFKSGWSLAILQHSYLLPALCIQKQLRSFSHFSTIRAQKLSHKPEGLVTRRRIFNIYCGQRQRYDWSWGAAIAAPVIDWFISSHSLVCRRNFCWKKKVKTSKYSAPKHSSC